MAVDTVVINSRFNGPPDSGNGGYVCGKVGQLVGGVAEVMLRHPPPLDKPLSVVYDEDEVVRVLDGETVVAVGNPTQWELELPALPTMAEATLAAADYPPVEPHPLPTCFVCGNERSKGDGLQVFTGKVIGRNLIAAPWVPHHALAGETGRIPPEYLWGVLDCPGGWAVALQIWPQLALLGKMSAQIKQPVYAGQTYLVMGWHIKADGRKHEAGTAVLTETGELCAIGKATWIALR